MYSKDSLPKRIPSDYALLTSLKTLIESGYLGTEKVKELTKLFGSTANDENNGEVQLVFKITSKLLNELGLSTRFRYVQEILINAIDKVPLERTMVKLQDTVVLERVHLIATNLPDTFTAHHLVLRKCYADLVNPIKLLLCQFIDSQLKIGVEEVKTCEFISCDVSFYCSDIKLQYTPFANCNIQSRRIYRAELEGVSFKGCIGELYATYLHEDNTIYCGCVSRNAPYHYLKEWFHHIDDGWIVFKSFDPNHKPFPSPETWDVREGGVIEELNDFSRSKECSYGISVGNIPFMQHEYPFHLINACFIPDTRSCGVVVPMDADNKIRTDYLEILNQTRILTTDKPGGYTVDVTLHGKRYTLNFDTLGKPTNYILNKASPTAVEADLQ